MVKLRLKGRFGTWFNRRATALSRVASQPKRASSAAAVPGPHLARVAELNGEDVAACRASKLLPRRQLLLIADLNLPQCKKYRVLQKVELLGFLGLDVVFSHHKDDFRAFRLMQLCTAVMFYRVPFNDMFVAYLAEARRLGLEVGYDLDDPIFDDGIYAASPNLNYLDAAERRRLIASAQSYADAMTAADYLVTSTPYLGKKMSDRFGGKPIFRLQNFIDSESLGCSMRLATVPPAPRTSDSVVISYASGSRAHEADFRMVSASLGRILASNPNVRVQILGFLNLPESLSEFADRIIQHPFTDHCGYLEFLARADIVIVPLVLDEFNECKSAIRYLEGALLGKPVVASNVGEFREAIIHDETGFKCEATEWSQVLSALVRSSEIRDSVGRAARTHVLELYTRDAVCDRLAGEFKETLFR